MGQAEHNPATPWGYCDANYAEDPHDWKSTSSYMFMLAGSSISWKSKKQPSISLCTTEAEYYTLGIACQEVEWIRQICLKLLMPLNGPIHIYLDNTGAVALSENPVFHSSQSTSTLDGTLSKSSSIPRLHTLHILGIQNRADFLKNAASSSWEWNRWLTLRRSVEVFSIIVMS